MTVISQDRSYVVMGQDCTPDESGFMKATGNGVILTDDIIKEIRYEMNRLTIHETAEKVLLGGECAQILLEEKEGSFRTIIEIRSSFSFGRRIHFVQEDNRVHMSYAKFKGLFTQLIGVPYRPSEDSARPVSVGCDYNPCPFFRSLDTSRCAHHLIAGPSTVASRPIQHKDIGAPVKKKEKRPRLILKLEKASEFREPLLSPRPFPKTNPFVFFQIVKF